MKKEADKLKCKNCKYKTTIANTREIGLAICSYPSSWFPVNIEDSCHFIPEKRKLLVVIVPDCMKIWHVLAALKMTVQYLTGNYVKDL